MVNSNAKTINCKTVLITTTVKTRCKLLRASCMLRTSARIPRTPSTMNTGCAIDVSNNPPSQRVTTRMLKGNGSVSPITPVMKSRYCKIATCIDPKNNGERKARSTERVGKKLPKAKPMTPSVIAPSNKCTERKNTILSVSPQPAKPIKNAGATNAAVKNKIEMKFF